MRRRTRAAVIGGRPVLYVCASMPTLALAFLVVSSVIKLAAEMER